MENDDSSALLQESSQDELWLMSYADLLTLLVGFFVLIIAGSGVKPSQFERMAASLTGAEPPPLEALRSRVEELIARDDLADKIVTRADSAGLGIEFKDALLFDSGSAEIRKEALPVVAKLAALLEELPDRPVIIEGHTDDVPIRTPVFASNWELSSARAINVLRALESNGVERRRMSVQAFADTREVATEGPLEARRSANRRVVVRVG